MGLPLAPGSILNTSMLIMLSTLGPMTVTLAGLFGYLGLSIDGLSHLI
jgi:hypothetical protein